MTIKRTNKIELLLGEAARIEHTAGESDIWVYRNDRAEYVPIELAREFAAALIYCADFAEQNSPSKEAHA